MRVVSLDLDRRNDAARIQLGPFSEGLNVICGPHRSGKTDLVRLMHRLISAGIARTKSVREGTSGDAAWNEANLPGAIHLADEQTHYRLTTNGQPKNPIRFEYRPIHGGSEVRVDSTKFSIPAWTRLPYHAIETVFLGGLSGSGVERLWLVANELGFGNRIQKIVDREYDALVAEESELTNKLRRASFLNRDRAWWVSEKLRVESKLREDLAPKVDSVPWSDLRYLEERVSRQQSELERLRKDEEELQSALRDRQARLTDWERVRASSTYRPEAIIAETRRKQLEDIDRRLYAWRHALQEVRDHRERLQILVDPYRFELHRDATIDSASQRNVLSSLETQTHMAIRHLQDVLALYELEKAHDTYMLEPLSGSLRTLDEGLRSVAQHITRSDMRSAIEGLSDPLDRLRRCEQELAAVLDRIVSERDSLLRQIASEYSIPYERLSLAVGDWVQYHENPHLYSWLLSDHQTPDRPSAGVEATELRRDIENLQQDLARVQLRIENSLRDCHEAEIRLKERRDAMNVARRTASTLTIAEREDLRRRLRRADEALAHWDQHGYWSRRLIEVQGLLRNRRPRTEVENTLRQDADRYYRELTGETLFLPNVKEEGGWFDISYAMDPSEANHTTIPSKASLSTAHSPFYSRSSTRQYDRDDQGSYLQRDWTHDHAVELCSDHQLSELSLRMAIADALVPKIGRFPIVVDDALHGLHGPLLDRVIAALIRYARQGQQILLLTGDEEVASRVRAHNGWVCHLRPKNAVAMDEVVYGSWRKPVVASESSRDINQWLHAYANEQDMELLPSAMRSERTPLQPHGIPTSRGRQFFLSERSWVDELPSIDARSALRLREKGVLDVATFLKSDPQQLASLLGVRHVDPSTIRVWQAEASLMCRVPQLRAFDARLLVACGITGPQMLAQMHPGQLLKRVEAFLATDKGQELLRTGNSYELSRITTWIASANRSLHLRDDQPYPMSDRFVRTSIHDPSTASPSRAPRESTALDQAYEDDRPKRARELHADAGDSPFDRVARSKKKRMVRRDPGTEPTRASRSQQQAHDRSFEQRATRAGEDRRQTARAERSARAERASGVVRMSPSDALGDARDGNRFYLDLSSPIVDAPTIGPQLAVRLNEIGVHLVSDLLDRNALSLAESIALPKYSARDVEAWQNQARMVCRIPNLRGHDAQLLVAAGFTSPEALTASKLQEVLARVSKVANSKSGQRILRGSKAPDEAEVKDWLEWAANSRPLRAA